MQPNLNNILQNKGFLPLTRDFSSGFDAQPTFTIADGVKGKLLETGVLLFEPKENQGSDIVISSGVHGNETAPIEMVDTIANQIISGELVVNNRLLLIIGNPEAMNKGKRFDLENMNRLFGKTTSESHHELVRAKQLEGFVRDFFEWPDEKLSSGQGNDGSKEPSQRIRLHYDLHTAIRASKYAQFAIYPYPDGRAWNKKQIEFFGACGISTLLLGHQPSGTFSYFSSHNFHAHAFTVELGQVKPFGENNPAEFAKTLRNLMALISGDPIQRKVFDNNDYRLFQVIDELVKQSDDFKLNFSESGANFTDFAVDYRLAEDINGGYTIKQEGDAIVFPNTKIPNGQRAGLIVRKTDI